MTANVPEMVERVAKAIYELDPFEEGGEYVDGFQVSPSGKLSWEQALARDAEDAERAAKREAILGQKEAAE